MDGGHNNDDSQVEARAVGEGSYRSRNSKDGSGRSYRDDDPEAGSGSYRSWSSRGFDDSVDSFSGSNMDDPGIDGLDGAVFDDLGDSVLYDSGSSYRSGFSEVLDEVSIDCFDVFVEGEQIDSLPKLSLECRPRLESTFDLEVEVQSFSHSRAEEDKHMLESSGGLPLVCIDEEQMSVKDGGLQESLSSSISAPPEVAMNLFAAPLKKEYLFHIRWCTVVKVGEKYMTSYW